MASVNNAFYDELGDRWYDDDTHAVALLRAESRLKLAYVREILQRHDIEPDSRILDVACGAGFLTIPLAEEGYRAKGIDLSAGSLDAARRKGGGCATLELAHENALALSDADGVYDAVLLLDFLEHVEDPAAAIKEAARVLRPGGVLVFHTFNRTLPARLLAIKALELLTRDCPEHVHVYEMFIKPRELRGMALAAGLKVDEIRGLRPAVGNRAFWWSVMRRRMHPDFSFVHSRSLAVGYIGSAVKRG